MKVQSLPLVLGLLALTSGCVRAGDFASSSIEASARQDQPVLLVKPYLQWGDSSQATRQRKLQLLWQTADVDENWSVDVRRRKDQDWLPAGRRPCAKSRWRAFRLIGSTA